MSSDERTPPSKLENAIDTIQKVKRIAGQETGEEGERKGVSAYLSPRAWNVLEKYVDASGYGSTSRTIEEIILAYNDIFDTINMTWAEAEKELGDSKSEVLKTILTMISHSTKRVTKEKGYEVPELNPSPESKIS